jgi:trehalose synthase-fused probable maltokinase
MTILGTFDGARLDFGRFSEALLRYTLERRWYRGKARTPSAATIVDLVPLPGRLHQAFAFLEIGYTEGEPDTYVLVVAEIPPDAAAALGKRVPHAIITPLEGGGALVDALASGDAAGPLLELLRTSETKQGTASGTASGGSGGRVRAEAHDALAEIVGAEPPEGRTPQLEQSNSTILYGDKLLVKVYRQIVPGENPEVEIGGFLTDACARRCAPRVLGTIHYEDEEGSSALAIAQEFVANRGDAWKTTLELLAAYFERAVQGTLPPAEPVRSLLADAQAEIAPEVEALVGPSLEMARLLGQRTAQIHLALASGTEPAFAPEPFTPAARAAFKEGAQRLAATTLDLLAARIGTLSGLARAAAERALARQQLLATRLEAVVEGSYAETALIRCHGDLHLGQVLDLGGDYLIIDFEGEPARPLAERRAKASPFKDVMGMIRSFDYAAESAARERRKLNGIADPGRLQAVAELWKRTVKATFLRTYLESTAGAPFVPRDERTLRILLDVYQLDKVVYEVGYELNNRPEWVDIPLRGLNQILDATP